MIKIGSIKTCALAAALAMALPLAHAATVAPTFSAKINLRNMQAQPQQGFDRFIVTYTNGSSESINDAAATQNVSAAVSRAGFNRATRSSTGATIAGLTVSHVRKLSIANTQLLHTSRKLSAAEATTLMQQIASDPSVAHVEPDVMMHLVRDISAPKSMTAQVVKPQTLLTDAPNDPYYAHNQWHLQAPTSADMGAANVPGAWALADGSGVVVAVLDTGITQHSDIDESLADAGYDFTSIALVSGRASDGRAAGGWDTGDWTTGTTYAECRDAGDPGENSSWHGTHVSGTIAELTNNGVGMAGVAHGAKVLPVRVLGHCGGMTSDIADAITWASGGHVNGVPDNTNPAQVISMSLGGGGTCTAGDVFGTAISGAISRGTAVVVAAGNSGSDMANFSPASCPGVISVASNGITGKRAFYSNYGTGVTISAPGGGIYVNDGSSGSQANPQGFVWSSVNQGTTVPETEYYGGMAGTSQATPHVAGALAMVLSAEAAAGKPISTPAELKDILTSSARAFPVTEDHPIGAGILDVTAAVNQAIDGDTGGGDGSTPVANFTDTVDGLTVSFTDGSTDADGTIASRSWDFGDGSNSTDTNPSHAYAAAGSYSVSLTVTDNDGKTNTKSASVTVSDGNDGGGDDGSVTTLTANSTLTGQSGAAGSSAVYSVVVPAGAKNLSLRSFGGSGNVSMYVKVGTAPAADGSDADYSSARAGNTETAVIRAPMVDTYYIRIVGVADYANLSILASYSM